MERPEIEMLRAGYEAFSRGDWDSVADQAHPDMELVPTDRVTNPGTYRGREQVRAFFEDLFAPFEEVITDPEEFHDYGHQIVVFVRVRSRPRGSTAVVDNRIAHLWTFRDGAPARMQIFPERSEALDAVEIPR
jgi:uncharacterized protein